MARSMFRLASSAAVVAALSMAAAPLAAAPYSAGSHALASAQAPTSISVGSDNADWRGRGRHGYRHRGGGVDGGDVLAGVLILGGIAAIASAASKNNDRNDDYRYREQYRENRPVYQGSVNQGPAYQNNANYSDGRGIDNAVDMCVGEVERGNQRVAAVDNAARTSDGWQISGQLDAGGNFSCAIDSDGRIRNVDAGGGYGYDNGNDNRPLYQGSDAGSSGAGQWNDDAYARARADTGYVDPYENSGG